MKDFIKGSVLTLINYALFFLVSVLISRWLGAEGFGDYSVAIAMANISATAATLGMEKLGMKKLSIYKANEKKYHQTSL